MIYTGWKLKAILFKFSRLYYIKKKKFQAALAGVALVATLPLSVMAQGKEPAVRKGLFPVPEGPGLGLDLNEDWLRTHVAKGETWWG